MTTVHGTCAPDFDGLREEFHRNLIERGDVGAAFAASVGGELVVDLWGGDADAAGRPWERDTLVNVYSVTSGLTALCAHLLADRGELDLDAPVARYWPAFAQQGKQDLPVRWLLNHRAGLIGPRDVLDEGAIHDWDYVCAKLAATRPWWEPGTAQGCHVISFGFLVGEVIRRISGLLPGSFLRAEITSRLRADLFLGTPVAEHARCADMIGQLTDQIDEMLRDAPAAPPRELADHPLAAAQVAFTHIPVDDVNSARWRSGEVPASNAHATARGLAKVYAALGAGSVVSRSTMDRMLAREGNPGEPDLVVGQSPSGYGLGFLRNGLGAFGPSPGAFGHDASGGSVAFADPENQVSFAYVTNTYGVTAADTRASSLVTALYTALR